MINTEAREDKRSHLRVQGLLALRVAANRNPRALAALARLLLAEGLRDEAMEAASRAVAIAEGDEAVRAVAADVLSDGVPAWHFVIVGDAARNDAYEAALRRAVTPGCLVLEVGTGTGLLAMMAARAGAGRVVTCEASESVARTAREIVARNGFADRITVIGRHSSALDLARDLGTPADVFVSEIVSNNLVGEGVFDVLEDVRHRLVRQGGAVIPEGGQLRVALCCDLKWESTRLGTISGFDLSPFNRLAPPRRLAATNAPRLSLRSDAASLFSIDLTAGGPFPDQSGRVVLRSSGGRVNAVAQWIALDLDGISRYENRPGPDANSCWGVILHPLGRTLDTQPGECLAVHGRLERHTARIWVEGVRP